MTINRQSGDPPPGDITVLVMPPDTGNQDDAVLSTGTPSYTRKYGTGTNVTLRAVEDIPGWHFAHWTINGLQVSPNPGPNMSVLMLGNRTVVPVFKKD
ncbi:MAG: hypothetical protein CHACPFDD_00649 [Phycisphaerae bacterium]|nr:hypothetical protein [Phycisphaerae bacterium]